MHVCVGMQLKCVSHVKGSGAQALFLNMCAVSPTCGHAHSPLPRAYMHATEMHTQARTHTDINTPHHGQVALFQRPHERLKAHGGVLIPPTCSPHIWRCTTPDSHVRAHAHTTPLPGDALPAAAGAVTAHGGVRSQHCPGPTRADRGHGPQARPPQWHPPARRYVCVILIRSSCSVFLSFSLSLSPPKKNFLCFLSLSRSLSAHGGVRSQHCPGPTPAYHGHGPQARPPQWHPPASRHVCALSPSLPCSPTLLNCHPFTIPVPSFPLPGIRPHTGTHVKKINRPSLPSLAPLQYPLPLILRNPSSTSKGVCGALWNQHQNSNWEDVSRKSYGPEPIIRVCLSRVSRVDSVGPHYRRTVREAVLFLSADGSD